MIISAFGYVWAKKPETCKQPSKSCDSRCQLRCTATTEKYLSRTQPAMRSTRCHKPAASQLAASVTQCLVFFDELLFLLDTFGISRTSLSSRECLAFALRRGKLLLLVKSCEGESERERTSTPVRPEPTRTRSVSGAVLHGCRRDDRCAAAARPGVTPRASGSVHARSTVASGSSAPQSPSTVRTPPGQCGKFITLPKE